MKRSIKTALALLLLLSCIAAFASCGIIQTYENITVQGEIYSFGKQTVMLNSILLEGGVAAKFKESISASDIEFSDALEGKVIDKVTFIDEYNVELELSGKTKENGGDGVFGTVTVLTSGLKSGGKSTCHIELKGPSVVTESAYSNSFTARDLTLYNVSSTISLPMGEFTDKADAEHIRLADPSLGRLEIKLEDGKLTLSVINCLSAEPSVIIAPEATTIGLEFSVCIGVYDVYSY